MRLGAVVALAMASACASSHDDVPTAPSTSTAAPALYTIGGAVTGLEGGLSLRNRGGDALVVAQSGAFRFPTPLGTGALYSVGISDQPPTQTCVVAAGDGVVTSDVTDIAVSCTSRDATIASLHLAQGGVDVPLTPAFRSDVASYTAGLFAVGGLSVDVILETTAPGTSWSVNGTVATNGKVSLAVPLTGTIALDVAVESPSRDHTDHYAVTVQGPERAIHSDAPDNARFGRSVATDGERIVVAEPYIPFDDPPGPPELNLLGEGRVHIYAPSADGWTEEATLDAMTPTAPGVPAGVGDEFGVAVALHGDLLVVGAPGSTVEGGQVGGVEVVTSGAVFVYRRKPSGWTRIAVLTSPATYPKAFGRTVATDGSRIAVGDMANRQTDLYLVKDDAVTFETALPALNAGAIVFMGDRIVTTDCWTATNFDVPNGFVASTLVHVYRNDASGWVADTAPTVPDGASSDNCMTALAASGTDLVIGAPFDVTQAVGVSAVPVPRVAQGFVESRGAAYVYTQAADGFHAVAVAKQTDPEAFLLSKLADDQWPRYGFDVAIDGNLILVGAPSEGSGAKGFGGDETDVSMHPSAGAAYVVTRDGSGAWSPRLYMKPSDTSAGLHYGVSVALAGGLAVVGSMRGVYIYRVPK